jgi:uncharacterized metal-binding protein YceD (DUF177 family)
MSMSKGFCMSGILVRTIRAAAIKAAPQVYEVVADAAERAALAADFGLPELVDLRGSFSLVHEQSGIIAANLHMTARLVQTCIVSLEPFPAKLNEHAALRFVPAAKLPENAALELDPESLDGPDEIPFTGDTIDLGAALAEQLALCLDPYPRKPGVALPDGAGARVENPFAMLKPLKPIE